MRKMKERGVWRVRREAGGMEGEAGQGLVATGSSGFGPSVRWGPEVGFEQKSDPGVLRHLGLGWGEGVAYWSATDPPKCPPQPRLRASE